MPDSVQQARFLVCDPCGLTCLLSGDAARLIAAHPPSCAGCARPMRVVDRPAPYRTGRRAS